MEEDQGALLCRQADTKQLGDQHAQRTEEVSHSLQQPHHRRGLGRRRRLPHRSEARCQILLRLQKTADRVGWWLQLGTWTRCARAAALPGGRRRTATRPCWAARTELAIQCCCKTLPKVSLIQAASSSLASRSRPSQSSYRIAMWRPRAGTVGATRPLRASHWPAEVRSLCRKPKKSTSTSTTVAHVAAELRKGLP